MEAQELRVAQEFASAAESFGRLVTKLGSSEAATMTHSQVESLLNVEGTELLRQLFQGYLDSLGTGTCAKPVRGADGVERTHERLAGHNLMSLFGPVRLERMGYGLQEMAPLYPLDAQLNMPPRLYSLGLERRAAQEVAKNSFGESTAAIDSTTGAHVPKRQAEEIAIRAAADFDAFYLRSERAAHLAAAQSGSLVVVTADGKGVVMRREDLRQATKAAAEKREHKLTTRLSKGEKRDAKRMAEVAAVYTIAPHYRAAEEIIGKLRPVRSATSAKRPRPEHKRVWASLAKDADVVIDEAFLEALRRDPARDKTWVALVDGNECQLKLVEEALVRHLVKPTIVVDFIHALEYLWKAARELLGEGANGEDWVLERALRLLHGEASLVAAGIRRSATKRGFARAQRKAMDKCADYLLKNAKYMRYDEYLARGFPIATGVIEGACRHLVKDRMDLTGARWGLARAEAVLQLRALHASGDFDAYWAFHEKQEHLRNHAARYFKSRPPALAMPARRSTRARTSLRLVKS